VLQKRARDRQARPSSCPDFAPPVESTAWHGAHPPLERAAYRPAVRSLEYRRGTVRRSASVCELPLHEAWLAIMLKGHHLRKPATSTNDCPQSVIHSPSTPFKQARAEQSHRR
jgi:hypothetical protein